MGPIALAVLLCGVSVAAPALDAVVTSSPPLHGAPFKVEIVTLDDGRPVDMEPPTVTVRGGEASQATATGLGRWVAEVIPEASQPSISVGLRWRGLERTLDVKTSAFLPSHLKIEEPVRGPIGERLVFEVVDGLGEVLNSAHIRVSSLEGTADVTCGGTSVCSVGFRPGDSPFPRVVPVFVHDERHPTRMPVVLPVRLFARPSIPVTTEPGATVRMSVGARTYGPKTAGEDGRVRFDVRVEPGDREAIVELEDGLGNKQTSTIQIGGVQGSTLALSGQGSIIAGGLQQ